MLQDDEAAGNAARAKAVGFLNIMANCLSSVSWLDWCKIFLVWKSSQIKIVSTKNGRDKFQFLVLSEYVFSTRSTIWRWSATIHFFEEFHRYSERIAWLSSHVSKTTACRLHAVCWKVTNKSMKYTSIIIISLILLLLIDSNLMIARPIELDLANIETLDLCLGIP